LTIGGQALSGMAVIHARSGGTAAISPVSWRANNWTGQHRFPPRSLLGGREHDQFPGHFSSYQRRCLNSSRPTTALAGGRQPLRTLRSARAGPCLARNRFQLQRLPALVFVELWQWRSKFQNEKPRLFGPNTAALDVLGTNNNIYTLWLLPYDDVVVQSGRTLVQGNRRGHGVVLGQPG